jgi:hypothetical protein
MDDTPDNGLDGEDLDELIAAVDGPTPEPSASRIDPVIPKGLVDYVRSICRTEWVVEKVLEAAATRRVLRRIRSNTPEARHARWSKRWLPIEQERTRRLLARVRDDVLRDHHLWEIGEHSSFASPPPFLLSCRPDARGHLSVSDTLLLKPSLGIPSYLEQTPPQLLAWLWERWTSGRLQVLADDVSLDKHTLPNIWDLTAGSGTALDIFGRVHGCPIIASDLVVEAAESALLDCRHVGSLAQHRHARRSILPGPDEAIPRPDLILFDPPSRGTPTHSQLYAGALPHHDLALLSREQWLLAIAFTVKEAVRHLAPGGWLSLLLRCGSRHHGTAEPDPQALEDLKAILEGLVIITHEMPIVFVARRSQVSLGQARVPATHLLIEPVR